MGLHTGSCRQHVETVTVKVIVCAQRDTTTTLSRLQLGEQFADEFDLGDHWQHLCTVGTEQVVDPAKVDGPSRTFTSLTDSSGVVYRLPILGSHVLPERGGSDQVSARARSGTARANRSSVVTSFPSTALAAAT